MLMHMALAFTLNIYGIIKCSYSYEYGTKAYAINMALASMPYTLCYTTKWTL